DTVWGVRLWIPYLSIPIGFGLFLLQLVADLVAVILRVDAPFGLEEG
ncbi:MAG: TRAP transporter small permease, partial [Pseudomonadota bacterium]